jgi:hypothetical protein
MLDRKPLPLYSRLIPREHFGYGIARTYAGHTDSHGPATTTYIKADLQTTATALAAMTGQPHPLAGDCRPITIRENTDEEASTLADP